ncbi:MAG TPA: VOC family protein, partial [Acidimicrobiales bacterium]|nr:VOC family protein [Acidimicrobiales bacterium]
GASWIEKVLVHPCGVVLTLQQHHTNAGETFDPVRTGMDHLALLVPSREELDAWCDELTRLGVEYSNPVEKHYGTVLSVKDPDRIALELFWRENHP